MLAVLMLNRITMKKRMARKQKVLKPVSVNLKELEVVQCRTCLSTENLESIFTSKGDDNERSQELLRATGLEIKKDDGLSQKICSKCVETVTMAVQFRRTSRKAEKTLLRLAGKKKKKGKLQKKTKETKKTKTKPTQDEDWSHYATVENLDTHDYGDIGDDNGCQDDSYQNDDYQDKVMDTVKKEVDTTEKSVPQKPAARAKKRQAEAGVGATRGARGVGGVGGRGGRGAPPGGYKCNTCGKEFRMKATYKAHTRFHTNFCICETCGKRCRNNHQLQEHKRARHGLGRIHKCAFCEYSSATKEALVIHERRHTGERPYVCDHCGATFHRRSNLVQHIAIHLPEKNFQCDMCPKRLKSRKFLQIHKHNVHTGRRYGYLCPVCDHRFEKPNKVRAHTRRVHGVPDERQGPIVRVQL